MLALAGKLLDEQDEEPRQDRANLEQGLTFLGLLLFRNELRPCSALAVKELSAGGVESRIVTGDNVWTGLRVADQCGVVHMQKMMMCVGDLDKDGRMVWEVNLPAERDSAEEEVLDDVDFEEAVLQIDFDAVRASRKSFPTNCLECDPLLGGSSSDSEASLSRKSSRVEIRGTDKGGRGRAGSKSSHYGASSREKSYFAENVFTADSDVFRGPGTRGARGSVSLGSIQGGTKAGRTSLAALAFFAPGGAPPGDAPCADEELPRLHREHLAVVPRIAEEVLQTTDERRVTLLSTLLESHRIRLYFALTQKAYSYLETHNPEVLGHIFPRVLVFGRMSPTGKIDVVQRWQANNKIVGMCGDGGNDVGALGKAHVGVALSESDASVVAPFSSTQESVRCCVDLVKNGRATLHNAVGVFFFFALACWVHMVYKAQIFTVKGFMPETYFYLKDLVLLPLLGCYCIASGKPDMRRPLSKTFAVSDPLGKGNLVFAGFYILLISAVLFGLFAILGGGGTLSPDWYRGNPDYAQMGLEPIQFISGSSHPLGAVVSLFELGMIFAIAIVFMLPGPARAAPTGRLKNFWTNKMFVVVLGVYVAATSLIWLPGVQNTSFQCFMRVNCDHQTSYEKAMPWLDWLLAGNRDVSGGAIFFREQVVEWGGEDEGGERGAPRAVTNWAYDERIRELVGAGAEEGRSSSSQEQFLASRGAAAFLQSVAPPLGASSSGGGKGISAIVPTVAGVAQEDPREDSSDALWQINWAPGIDDLQHLDEARALIEGAEPLLSENTSWNMKLDVRVAVGSTPVVAVRFLPGDPSAHDGDGESSQEQPPEQQKITSAADDRIFECQRLCERTWSLGKDNLPNSRFLCWWVAVAKDGKECFLLPRRTTSGAVGLDISTPDSENSEYMRPLAPFRQVVPPPTRTSSSIEDDSTTGAGPASSANGQHNSAPFRAFILNRSNVLGQYPVSSDSHRLGYYTTGEINYSFRVFLFLWPVGIFAAASAIWWALRHWR